MPHKINTGNIILFAKPATRPKTKSFTDSKSPVGITISPEVGKKLATFFKNKEAISLEVKTRTVIIKDGIKIVKPSHLNIDLADFMVKRAINTKNKNNKPDKAQKPITSQ